ncbi:alpha/beta fold hydrolase [Patescibacteria group bacterium]|nr:alpha/beta fold hydrolase [Patescibacteria group bacterium]
MIDSRVSMKKLSLVLVISIFSFLAGWWLNSFFKQFNTLSTFSITPVTSRPLDKYTIERLSKTEISPGKLQIEETIEEENEFTSYLFSFKFNPTLDGKEIRKTTGQINVPGGEGPFPVVVMFRGYIDQERYITGDGTRRAAGVYAENGFITVAPDFLGYGDSDDQAENIFEARFQTYVTVLSLVKSIEQVQDWDEENVFLWGHSNGGQIALTYLEITGSNYPTTLWAPVSKPFPYSVLYYTDAAEDRGKLIRRKLAAFEENYDPDLYSIDLYLDGINTPLQLHQGTADESVPRSWSDKLSENLLNLGLDLNYFIYPGTNHNMVPSWNTVVSRDLEFFKVNLK